MRRLNFLFFSLQKAPSHPICGGKKLVQKRFIHKIVCSDILHKMRIIACLKFMKAVPRIFCVRTGA